MAELTGGADLDLAVVPLKQAGLSPLEILVSESQERMTVGVSPKDHEAFEAGAGKSPRSRGYRRWNIHGFRSICS